MASRLGSVKSSRYYVKLGGAVGDIGEIKFGFVASQESYQGISDELGVITIGDDDSARGIVFGANYPKPPRVRISYENSNKTKKGSTIRYCDPDKVGRVLNGSLNDAEITVNGTKFKVRQVSMA